LDLIIPLDVPEVLKVAYDLASSIDALDMVTIPNRNRKECRYRAERDVHRSIKRVYEESRYP